MLKTLISLIFTRENLLAFVIAAILFALVVLSAKSGVTWIYKGF